MAINTAISEADNVAALIKASNPKFTYPLSSLTFDAPTDSEEEGFNTSIKASAKAGQKFEGDNVYNFNRLDVRDSALRADTPREFTLLDGETEEQLTARVFGVVNLHPAAVEAKYDAPQEGADGQLEISAKEGSLLYLPTPPVFLPIKAAEVGPEPEPEVPEYITPPVVSNEPLSARELKEDGTLQIGTNNPATDLTKVSNGELSLATSGRVYRSTETITPSDTTYTIALNDDQDWNFPISIALINAPAGTLVTDLYDVIFTMRAVDTERHIDFNLTHDGSKYHLENGEIGLDIDDSITLEDGSGLQNIQRNRFYAAELGLTEFNTFGATLGNFQFGYTAIRKVGDVEPLELWVNVTTDPVSVPQEV